MWKPGTAKPNGSLTPSSSSGKKKKKPSRPKLDLGGIDDDIRGESITKTTTPSSSTPRKRLSGGTMNMRFMKRRTDTISDNNNNNNNEDEKRKNNNSNSSKTTSSHQRMEKDDAMDIDKDDDDDNGGGANDASTEKDNVDGSSYYAQATSVDMYGIEASLIGRRSFRGFNTAMERIYKDSKACLEKRGDNTDRPTQKVSDEELLLRYQENRGKSTGGGRGVGSFDKKNKNKKRR